MEKNVEHEIKTGDLFAWALAVTVTVEGLRALGSLEFSV